MFHLQASICPPHSPTNGTFTFSQDYSITCLQTHRHRFCWSFSHRPVLLKSYACLFVCFSTRAVHLELCADLSTDEFLAAFQRFCACRGAPAHVYTDNGSNFVGARNEIQELHRLHFEVKESFSSHFCSEASITWHFIPPRTPHFGGLWESGVKSMKALLRKMVALIHSSFTS